MNDSIAWSTDSESMILGLLNFAWSASFLQPKQNFFDPLGTTFSFFFFFFFFLHKKYFLVSALLWPSLNSKFPNHTMLRIYLYSFQSKQHSNYHSIKNHRRNLILIMWCAVNKHVAKYLTQPSKRSERNHSPILEKLLDSFFAHEKQTNLDTKYKSIM